LAQAKHKKKTAPPAQPHTHRGLREGTLLIFIAVSVYLLLSLLSYSKADPAWSHTGDTIGAIHNLGGISGAYFADVFLYWFGLMAYLFPVMLGYSGWLLYRGREEKGFDAWHLGLRAVGFLLTLVAGAGLASLHVQQPELQLPLGPGGILGDIVGSSLVSAFSFLGATLLQLALFLAGITLFTGLSWFWLMDVTGKYSILLAFAVRHQATNLREYLAGRRARQQRTATVESAKRITRKRKSPVIEKSIPAPKVSARAERERQVPLFETVEDTPLPPISLLDEPTENIHKVSNEALEAISQLVEIKFRDFGIEVEVVAVHPGPVITRFELQPAAGVKVSQISNLAKDLARALATVSVRIVEVIPGKSVIGLEVPNENREIVRLSEIINSQEYDDNKSGLLSIALGKDIAGYPKVYDLGKMPHMLVAGTTGSGKSVAINAMILSLLYNATPHDVRLIMVDPKMLELSIYEGIPHLLTPVVTDMKDAANALRWCVAEMERRYKLMAALGVRHLNSYNRKIKEADEKGEPIPDPLFKQEDGLEETPPNLEHLPFIVIIIDELADMMMVVGKKVDELIARLAQKARASGIHLILATQRPSVDVITGLIKANIPTRVAFQVSSKIDSRTILDQGGAEQLLGHGDMLYMAPGSGVPTRIHGAFVSDEEVHKVVANLKGKGEPDYIENIVSETSGDGVPGMPGGDSAEAEDADPLYDQAVAIVTQSRRASISGVQRRLKVGYNRAARMIEEMERTGVVSEVQSNGMREVIAPPPPEA